MVGTDPLHDDGSDLAYRIFRLSERAAVETILAATRRRSGATCEPPSFPRVSFAGCRTVGDRSLRARERRPAGVPVMDAERGRAPRPIGTLTFPVSSAQP